MPFNINPTSKLNYYFILFCSIGHTSTAKLLIEKGADIEHQSNSGMTSLMFASIQCKSDRKEHQSKLLMCGVLYIFSLILFKASIETVRLLLEKSANVNHLDKSDDSAIIYAATHGKSRANPVK